jgi:hypothetical protein
VSTSHAIAQVRAEDEARGMRPIRLPPVHHYGTQAATAQAKRLGVNASESDFRTAFLEITGAQLGEPSSARYIGATRDAERWRVTLAGRSVEAIYAPDSAAIVAVLAMRARREPI